MLLLFGTFTAKQNNHEAAIACESQQISVFLEGVFPASSK